jgi:hypothetical protein
VSSLATLQQPAPTGEGVEVWPQLLALPDLPDWLREDMKAREALGIERYGTPLRTFNGRASLVDAYQEALDLCAYLQQADLERQPHLESSEALERALALVELVGFMLRRHE